MSTGIINAQEICDNGIDDDGDLLIDLNDTTDCQCTLPATVASLFPNPSFEEFDAAQGGCTSGQDNGLPDAPGQVDCLVGWQQASLGTTDSWNAFTLAGAGPDWPPALPQPLPGGTGTAGFWAELSEAYVEDGGEDGTGAQLGGYKEYLGACLTGGGTLATDREYRMTLEVGFMTTTSVILPGENYATRVRSPSPAVLAFYGIRSCDSLYFESNDCPQRSDAPGWELISEFRVPGREGTWSSATVDFVPNAPFAAIAIGPACASVKDRDIGWRHYYFIDELRINERTAFGPEVSGPIRVTGNSVCDDNILLEGDTRAGATYQWFKNGVAIDGATAPAYHPPPNLDVDGNYQLRTTSPAGCSLSDKVVIQRPVLPVNFVSDSVSFCDYDGANAFYLTPRTSFHARYEWSDLSRDDRFLVTEPGEYSVTVSTPCQRLVETFHVTEDGNHDFRAVPTPATGCREDTVRIQLESDWFYGRFEVTNQYGIIQQRAQINQESILLPPPLPPEIHILGYSGNCDPDTVKLFFPLSGELSASAAVIPVGCFPAAGSINLTTAAASAVFEWTGPGVPAGTTGNTLSTTTAGHYAVTITDGNHCPFVAEYDLPFSDGFAATPLLVPDHCTALHDVSIAPAGGTAPYAIDWFSRSNGQLASGQASIPGLPAGDYFAEISDGSACRRRLSFSLPELPVFRFTDLEPRTDCRGQGGAITARLENGTPPYTYYLNDGPGQADRTFTGLAAGTYFIGARDANGCRVYGEPVPLRPPSDFSVDIGPDLLSAPGEPNVLSQRLFPADQPVESFAWRPYRGLACWDCPEAIATINETTTYHLTVTSPDGCTRSDSLTISVDNLPRYYLPTAFSPNGDGLNDHLILYLGPGAERVEILEIYDRWGQLVWSYGPDSDSWDGYVNGRPGLPGVYTYSGAVKLKNGSTVNLSGVINLLR